MTGRAPPSEQTGAQSGSEPTGAEQSRPREREPERRPLDQSVDDTDAGWGEAGQGERSARDTWLLDQRPPHWD